MRLKPVPPAPDDREALAAAKRAVPLVPGSESDCCARLRDRLDLRSRDEARTWLTFLRALGLADRTADGGFVRTDRAADDAAVPRAFRERVFAAREVLDALGDEPRSADEVFADVADVVPEWERDRADGWRSRWRDRVARLLDWAVVLGLADRTDGEYVAAAGDATPERS